MLYLTRVARDFYVVYYNKQVKNKSLWLHNVKQKCTVRQFVFGMPHFNAWDATMFEFVVEIKTFAAHLKSVKFFMAFHQFELTV